jgi:hypothetical protein
VTDVPSAILAALNKRADGVRVLQAVFVSVTATGCQVDIQGNRVPATLGTDWLPEVGEVVSLWVIGEWYLIMGPAAVKPDSGTVVSASGGFVTLTTSIGTTLTCPYDGSAVTPSAGQLMKILWQGGPFAMLMSTTPAPTPPPPAPSPGVNPHDQTFTAIDAGSYGSGRWWTPQVWASDSNVGAWFYGTKISDTIPSTAAVSAIQVWVPGSTQISGSAPNFGVHGYTTKPGGAPTISSVTTVGISPGWVNLPVSTFANFLKNGGGAYGIGVAHGGYNIFPSLASDGMSGAIRVVSTY